MFEVGRTIIEDVASAAESLSKAAPTPVSALETSATAREAMPQVMASRGTKRRAKVRLALRRSADKPARYPKEGAGIGVGGPIIAVEEGQRKSVRPASETRRSRRRTVKDHRLEREERRHSRPRRQSMTRAWGRIAPVIAVEESRRKSKSGRG